MVSIWFNVRIGIKRYQLSSDWKLITTYSVGHTNNKNRFAAYILFGLYLT